MVSSKTENLHLNDFLGHVLKILNIFEHLFVNTKPLIIPKGHKADIFLGAKEVASMNNIGFFGNENFYLKLYEILKSSYQNYKVSGLKTFSNKILKIIKNIFFRFL